MLSLHLDDPDVEDVLRTLRLDVDVGVCPPKVDVVADQDVVLGLERSPQYEGLVAGTLLGHGESNVGGVVAELLHAAWGLQHIDAGRYDQPVGYGQGGRRKGLDRCGLAPLAPPPVHPSDWGDRDANVGRHLGAAGCRVAGLAHAATPPIPIVARNLEPRLEIARSRQTKVCVEGPDEIMPLLDVSPLVNLRVELTPRRHGPIRPTT